MTDIRAMERVDTGVPGCLLMRSHCLSILIAVSACGSNPPPATPAGKPVVTAAAEPRPDVELVVAALDSTSDTPRTLVRFAKTAPAGIVVTRTVMVPGEVKALSWKGPEPVVMLDSGEVGHISAAGYERFPAVRDVQWSVPKPTGSGPDTPTGRFDTPRWRLLVGSKGEVWQARCDWGWDLPHGMMHHCVPEGGRCDAWVFARLWPGATTISQTEPQASFDSDEPPSLLSTPEVTPSTAIHAELVTVPPENRSVLRCSAGADTIQYPTDDDRDMRDNSGDGVGGLTWLSTTPPLFSVTRRVGCLETESVVFEGCKQSDTYTGAIIGGGPSDVLVIWQRGDKVWLRWHDRDLGSIDNASLLAFAPAH